MLSWWKGSEAKTENPEECFTLTIIREKFDFLVGSEDRYQTVVFLDVIRSTITMLGNLGSTWKFALSEVMKSVDAIHELYQDHDHQEIHPFRTLQELVQFEKQSPQKKGTANLIDLLHMLTYTQALLEELAYGKSNFIYNPMTVDDGSSTEVESIPDHSSVNDLQQEFADEPASAECEDSTSPSQEESPSEEKEEPAKKHSKWGWKKFRLKSVPENQEKSLRVCAYDAYISSLAPKHPKAIRYMVWTATLTLPSRKVAYQRVFKLGEDETKVEISNLLPKIERIRDELYRTISN